MAFFSAKGLRSLPQVLLNGVQLDLDEVRLINLSCTLFTCYKPLYAYVFYYCCPGPGGCYCESVAAADLSSSEMDLHGWLVTVLLTCNLHPP